MDFSRPAKRYYNSFARLNNLLKTALVIKAFLLVGLFGGLGTQNFLTLKLMFILLTVSWWLLWWGIHIQEDRRINQELWQAYMDSFVPVSFTGHIIGYGSFENLQGHILNRETFWFFIMDEPDLMFDAPVSNCLGNFTQHKLEGDVEHAV